MAFGIISVSWENPSSFQGPVSNQMPASQDTFHDEQISSLHTHTHTHTHTLCPFHAKHVPCQANKLHTHTHTHTHTHPHTPDHFSPSLGAPIWEVSLLRADACGSHRCEPACYLLGGSSLRCTLSKVGGLKWGSKPSLLRSEVRIHQTPVFLKPSLCGSFSGHGSVPEITHYYNSAQSRLFPGQ